MKRYRRGKVAAPRRRDVRVIDELGCGGSARLEPTRQLLTVVQALREPLAALTRPRDDLILALLAPRRGLLALLGVVRFDLAEGAVAAVLEDGRQAEAGGV